MHSSSSRKPVALIALAALVVSVTSPLAARADGGDAKANAAGVGVARISYIQGSVAVQRGDSATAGAAAINAPVLGADYVTTGENARAEVQFDGSSSVRLGAGVQMRFTHLDTGDRELQLAEGTIELRLLRGVDGRTQIDTPSISVRPRAAGGYRVTVDSDGHTQVTVRSGSADIIVGQETRALASGTTLLAQGVAASPVLQYAGSALAYDDFDTFNGARDERELRALADAAYVAPGVTGVDDLDAYGRWVSDPSYGHVWVPYHVASDWAPYRDGRWVWEDSYGWTWVGYEPWGWAPYHYGRWYHRASYGWCWYPDPFVTVWRPALVGFIAFGNFGNGFGLGFGNIGWVALGPLEPFNPWWGNGFGRTTIVNVTNVTNNYYITNNNNVAHVYGNAKYNGVTYVPQRSFMQGRFEHRAVAEPSRLNSVYVVRGTVPVVPTHDNLRYSERPVAADAALRPALLQRSFAGNAAVVQRTPFEQQRTALANAPRARLVQPPATAERSAAVMTAPATATATTPANLRAATDPWSRFGTSRGVPETMRTAHANVPVIDGAAGARAPQAFSRFDGSAPRTATSSAQTTRSSEPVRPSYALPASGNDTQRTYAAPAQRTNDTPRTAQPAQRTYETPRTAQPAQPPRTTTTTTTTTATPHVQRSTESHATETRPHN